MRDRSEEPSASSQGLAPDNLSNASMAHMRSRIKSREVSERKQVGDAESMMNEEPAANRPGGASEWLE